MKVFLGLALCFLLACSGGQKDTAEQTANNSDQKKLDVTGVGADNSTGDTQHAEALAQDLKIMIVDPETGEKIPVDAEARVIQGDSYIHYRENNKYALSLDEAVFYTKDLKPVKIPLDRVTVIEYWNEEAMKENQFWQRAREAEQHYGSDVFSLFSVHHNQSLSGREQVESIDDVLADYSMPQNLIFDTMDVMRDKIVIPGPVSYYLIDHRRQVIRAFSGDDPEGWELFDKFLENSIIHQRIDRKQSSVQVTYERN